MKAKEYFERYVNDNLDKPNEWKLLKTFRDIFCEAQDIAEKRKATSDNSYKSIFKELNQKANSFCRMVNEIDDLGIKENAFMIFVQSENPTFYKMIYQSDVSTQTNGKATIQPEI